MNITALTIEDKKLCHWTIAVNIMHYSYPNTNTYAHTDANTYTNTNAYTHTHTNTDA